MWRAKTKADTKREEAAAQKKYAKGLDWNPGYTQTHSVSAGAAAYDARQEQRRKEEAEREAERQEKQAKEEAFIKQIASVQEDGEAFIPADLYDAGIEAREGGNGLEAVARLWQALVCGDGRAAYPLFEMLRDGEGGISKNMEMAGMFLLIGKICNDRRCIETPNLKEMPFNTAAAEVVASVYTQSRDFIFNPNYKITAEIMAERQAAANEALDGFDLRTRAHEQAMVDVFKHPAVVVAEEAVDVPPTGDMDIGGGGSGVCCIL